jgi:hypothetical protein
LWIVTAYALAFGSLLLLATDGAPACAELKGAS